MSGSEWRDIESAPKDGSDILIFHLGRMYVASWQPVWHPDNKKWVVRHAQAHPDDENRAATDLGPDYDKNGVLVPWSRPGPTHWMPLPAPPGADPGIPVLRIKDATPDVRPTCVTCGQSFDLQDPDQVAYHDQEGDHPPMR